MDEISPARRDLLLTALLAAVPLALASGEAAASAINPAETIVRPPDEIKWFARSSAPPKSIEAAPLFGSLTGRGIYYMLVKWHPGYMSAPHTYVTDRLCVVVSGTWWVNSGADFDPAHTIPAPAGSFVRRVAHTPHYDGVRADGTEPAVIAICGIAPVGRRWLEPTLPKVRKV